MIYIESVMISLLCMMIDKHYPSSTQQSGTMLGFPVHFLKPFPPCKIKNLHYLNSVFMMIDHYYRKGQNCFHLLNILFMFCLHPLMDARTLL